MREVFFFCRNRNSWSHLDTGHFNEKRWRLYSFIALDRSRVRTLDVISHTYFAHFIWSGVRSLKHDSLSHKQPLLCSVCMRILLALCPLHCVSPCDKAENYCFKLMMKYGSVRPFWVCSQIPCVYCSKVRRRRICIEDSHSPSRKSHLQNEHLLIPTLDKTSFRMLKWENNVSLGFRLTEL
jgi:hypothetical protein